MTSLSASEIASFYRPSKCLQRFDCRRRGLTEGKPDPYEEVLKELGKRYESQHRLTLEPLLDLSEGSLAERALATRDALRDGSDRIYQPVLAATAPFDAAIQLRGIPDFLLREQGGYVVRDCKTSRRIEEHPEILEQVDLYGWLVEMNTGHAPVRLEILAGDGTMHNPAYDQGRRALDTLSRVSKVLTSGRSDYEPVGWSKCQSCTYGDHCWPSAVGSRDPAVLPDVDQATAVVLHGAGILDFRELRTRFTVESLAQLKRPRGQQMVRIGAKAAASILNHAEALTSDRPILLKRPNIPASDNYVMFDLEGLPPQLDDTDKIYLWGMQVFGKKPTPCIQPVAGFGTDGDREGWIRFLNEAKAILREYGDIPFVHWFRYEKGNLKKYIDRFGDPEGVASRVDANLCDLLERTKECVVLPTYSYSIKQVEGPAGYSRKLEEYGGRWSMAQYIKAVETKDEKLRKETMDKILAYNREDLEATWAVQQWLSRLVAAR
jgi:predicted RecB family nuclease